MRVAIFCLEKRLKGRFSDECASRRAFSLDALQALGIAKALREHGGFDPLIVADKGGSLEQAANDCGLPHLATGSFFCFRLWRRLSRDPFVVIQTIGEGSLNAGFRLFRIRKKGCALLAHAFFSCPPEKAAVSAKVIRQASHILCGDSLIAANLRAAWPQAQGIALDAPGLALEEWRRASPWRGGDGRRFVFGMGESLIPGSGALLVVRAMSALWQRPDLPPWEARMFGAGRRFQEVLAEAENLGVASRLSLLSDQPLEQTAALCDAWLLPGENPCEEPQTTWAGIAAALPAVCVKSPLHDERLAAANDAPAPVLRMRPNDPQGFARAMIALMKNESLRARLLRGADALRRRIGVEETAQRTVRLYETWTREANGSTKREPEEER